MRASTTSPQRTGSAAQTCEGLCGGGPYANSDCRRTGQCAGHIKAPRDGIIAKPSRIAGPPLACARINRRAIGITRPSLTGMPFFPPRHGQYHCGCTCRHTQACAASIDPAPPHIQKNAATGGAQALPSAHRANANPQIWPRQFRPRPRQVNILDAQQKAAAGGLRCIVISNRADSAWPRCR